MAEVEAVVEAVAKLRLEVLQSAEAEARLILSTPSQNAAVACREVVAAGVVNSPVSLGRDQQVRRCACDRLHLQKDQRLSAVLLLHY